MSTDPAVYLCLDDGPLVAEPCPAGAAEHEPQPDGYGDRWDWAAEMYGAGWRQVECPGCGALVQWVAPPGVVRPPWPPRGDGYSDRAPWNQPGYGDDLDWSDYWSDGITIYRGMDTIDPDPRYL